MQYITLLGVPTTGTLYYNYYGTSTYGTTARTQITVANCASMSLYASPSSAAQYSLTELTYVPSGVNYLRDNPLHCRRHRRCADGLYPDQRQQQRRA